MRAWLFPTALWLALFAPACQRRAPQPDAPSSLLVGRAADAIGLDPARVTDAESVEVSEQIFEHLVRLDRRGDIEPALAERWDSLADGKEWIFHLRKGVRFHDGNPVDADAVVFSFERQRDTKHPFHCSDFEFESLFNNIVRIEKVGPLDVRILIEEPYAPFLANLATFPMSIVSPRSVEQWGNDFRSHPVGSGPFRFVEWAPGERITLEANPDYWGGAPRLQHIAFVPVPNPRQRLVSLEGGAIDVAENLAPQDLQFLALHPDLRTERVPGHNVGYLAMNTQRPPFDDVRVRRAIAAGINKEAIVKLVYQGLGVEATGPLAPSMWGHVDLPPVPYNPTEARRLLAEAGWKGTGPGGKKPRLFVPSTPRTYLPSPERVAQMIAQNLHDVGMDVDVVALDMPEHLRATAAGEHDLCLIGWTGDNGDPDNFLYTLFHSDNTQPGIARNLAFLKDRELDGILRWAQESPDKAQRLQLYERAQRIIADRVPWVPLAHSQLVVARRRTVHGLWLPPTSTLYFHHVAVEGQ